MITAPFNLQLRCLHVFYYPKLSKDTLGIQDPITMNRGSIQITNHKCLPDAIWGALGQPRLQHQAGRNHLQEICVLPKQHLQVTWGTQKQQIGLQAYEWSHKSYSSSQSADQWLEVPFTIFTKTLIQLSTHIYVEPFPPANKSEIFFTMKTVKDRMSCPVVQFSAVSLKFIKIQLRNAVWIQCCLICKQEASLGKPEQV